VRIPNLPVLIFAESAETSGPSGEERAVQRPIDPSADGLAASQGLTWLLTGARRDRAAAVHSSMPPALRSAISLLLVLAGFARCGLRALDGPRLKPSGSGQGRRRRTRLLGLQASC
jgi:hypothetical protein